MARAPHADNMKHVKFQSGESSPTNTPLLDQLEESKGERVPKDIRDLEGLHDSQRVIRLSRLGLLAL